MWLCKYKTNPLKEIIWILVSHGWDVTLLGLAEVRWRFGEMHCLHLQGQSLLLVVFLACSLTMKIEVELPYKAKVKFYQTIQYHISEESTLQDLFLVYKFNAKDEESMIP